jgi:hypothetical protein
MGIRKRRVKHKRPERKAAQDECGSLLTCALVGVISGFEEGSVYCGGLTNWWMLAESAAGVTGMYLGTAPPGEGACLASCLTGVEDVSLNAIYTAQKGSMQTRKGRGEDKK